VGPVCDLSCDEGAVLSGDCVSGDLVNHLSTDEGSGRQREGRLEEGSGRQRKGRDLDSEKVS
jgi:hypothetical protein